MKKYILLTLSFAFYGSQFAQTAEKTVLLTVSGQGSSLDNARQSALRTAIEQAFGTFISAKTEILNDNMVADQITSVSSGNVQSFEVLNEGQLPNNTWAVTMKVTVSLDKLAIFVNSKGFEVEVKGSLYALNIKQQMLNEKGELDAICDMIGLLHEPMQSAFDYFINTKEPKSLDGANVNWTIPIEVYAVANANFEICMEYLVKTLESISLTPSEVESYEKLNKKTFELTIFDSIVKWAPMYSDEYSSELSRKIIFRNAKSIKALMCLINNWEFYTTNFEVTEGAKKYSYFNVPISFSNRGNDMESDEFSSMFPFGEYLISEHNDFGLYHSFEYFHGDRYYNDKLMNHCEKIRLRILSRGDTAARFIWNDHKSLVQLEKLEKYSIASNGVVSEFKNGGFVVYQDSGHGLVASILDIDNEIDKNYVLSHLDSFNLDSICSLISLNGYSDWKTPSLLDMKLISRNLFSKNISIFNVTPEGSAIEGGGYRYLCKSDSSLVFLNNDFQKNSGRYIEGWRRRDYYAGGNGMIKWDITEQNLIRETVFNKAALCLSNQRLAFRFLGTIRPVRHF